MTTDFVEFEVAKEDWSIYRVEDGSMVKIKFVLHFVMKLPNDQARLGSQMIVIPEPPPELRGPPGGAPNIDQIRASVVAQNLKFTQERATHSVYVLEDGKVLTAYPSMKGISRSSLNDVNGFPAYVVDTEARIEVAPAAPSPR
jgi:hypothetical protein